MREAPEDNIKVVVNKDKQGRLRKKTNDYSGLQTGFVNELDDPFS